MSRLTRGGKESLRLPAQAHRRLSLGAWRLRCRGPVSVVEPVAAVLGALRVQGEEPAALDLRITPDGRDASAFVAGRLLWSAALPPAGWLAVLAGRIVASLTSLLTRLLFVHGSAVAVGSEGWAVVGESGAGKTSLTGTLLRRGARYLSDDLILLDPGDGTMRPVAIPLSLKPWTVGAIGELPPGREVASDETLRFWMPADVAGGPIRCRTLVFLSPGRGRARVAPLSRGQALLAIARQTSSFTYRDRAEDAFAGFARVVREARCLRITGARAAAAADALLAIARHGDHRVQGGVPPSTAFSEGQTAPIALAGFGGSGEGR